MADVNKTIDIQVKADMKQLLNEFKNMPGMTSKEAKKMVSQLSQEFKAAEQAAKKAADANAKSMKRIGDQAKNSAKQIRDLKKASREVGGALQATGDIIGEIDPALGGMVTTVSMVGMAFKDLGKALLTGNPIILGLTVGVSALAGVYAYFNSQTVAVDNSQKAVNSAIKNANIALKEQYEAGIQASNALAQHINTVRDLELEFKLMSGAITQFEFDMENAKIKADEMYKDLEGNVNNVNKANEKAVNEQAKVVEKLRSHVDLLAEQGGKVQELAKAKSKLKNAEEDLATLEKIREVQALRGQAQAEEQAVEYEKMLNKIAEVKEADRKKNEAEKKARQDAQKASERRNKSLQAEAKAKAEADKAEAENLAELNRLLGIENDLIKAKEEAQKQSANIENQNQRIRISMMETESEKITENLKLEQDAINEKIDLIKKEQEANLKLAEDEYQKQIALEGNLELENQIALLKEQSHLKEMEANNDRLKALEEERKKRIQLVEAIVNQTTTGFEAVSQIIKNVSGENKKAALIAFRINQAASLANIAMTTASKIMEVAPNPFAIAGIATLGALQAGVVATQSPPEAHMGGVIDKGEDTRNITVLTGEAVLDRRTVQRLGGDAGISQLQRGKMPQNQVVVMNPYKHFDRYVKASSQRGGIMNQFSNKKASGDY